MVVILDKLSTEDIYKYHDMINKLPYREMICGFFSGKDELLHWEVSELFQFYYDTKPILGSLDVLLNSIDDASVERAIKTGACSTITVVCIICCMIEAAKFFVVYINQHLL